MNIKEILNLQMLYGAKLIAGNSGILNEITGVNVLEATDIANWGRHGEVILTSFFALQHLSESELEVFFEKLYNVGISAFIIKIDRLVTHIPDKIIELCDKHAIPLIQINKDVKYEAIILEILGPIVNKNMNLLNKYYEVHSELTKLALKMPSMDVILREFKKMILRDVSLINSTKGIEISTNPGLADITVVDTREVLTEKYMHFKYERRDVLYNGTNPPIAGKQIRVHIPHLGHDDYELVIHELPEQISSEDFMVIENGVKFLQMELLKKYVISQNLFQQKNNIINDLLNDRLYEEKDIDEVLESLNIKKHKYYQVVLIKLYPRDEKKNMDKDLMPQTLRQIWLTFKTIFKDIVFLEKLDTVVFVFNFSDEKAGLTPPAIEKTMNSLVAGNVFDNFYYNVSLSSKVEKLSLLKAHREVLDTEKILRLFHGSNNILPYEELGIYKLFLDSNNLDDLEKFISPRIANFRHHYPLLFDTLQTFLDTNQNYFLTSEKLFLHSKTVRYRVAKIKNILNVDFANPEELLQIQIAARLFKLIDGRKKHE
ncbi:putative Purine catabolism PurC domain protein [uncultured Sporomusa sp.]|uniref:Putative Purine catabolism PurC domain protein n=1 Tax=uncultured Sporomusa sp. TaxID=307249 RepID=A0A212M0J8_9FIRM|nr:PucR family transcriptional regulator [uncultured Sporomusa sp.]SCM83364.1 putative Purine catabolism PurC domain protein [uncultured Sporomusa sp.]